MRAERETTLQTNSQLQFRITELESNMTTYDSVTNKSSLAITVLQRDAKEKQDQVVELEGRVRYCVKDESVERSSSLACRLEPIYKRAKRANERSNSSRENCKSYSHK